MKAVPFAALVLAWAVGAAAQAPPPAKTEADRVRDLIEKLGDDDYDTRMAAEWRLLCVGKAHLPLLKKAVRSPDLEIRNRSKRVLEELTGDTPDLIPERFAKRFPKAVGLWIEPAEAKRIAAVIRKLGDDSFKTREAATKELLKLDKDVLPLLARAKLDAEEHEVRMRLDKVLKAIWFRK